MLGTCILSFDFVEMLPNHGHNWDVGEKPTLLANSQTEMDCTESEVFERRTETFSVALTCVFAAQLLKFQTLEYSLQVTKFSSLNLRGAL